MASGFRPADYQPPLPADRLILSAPPDAERLEMGVLIVGGGPAGLACAIHLAQLTKQNPQLGQVAIGVLEKSHTLGEHCLSGAVVNPRAFGELFPDMDPSEWPLHSAVEREAVYLLSEQGSTRLPTPPTMKNQGNRVGSICEIVRWLGERAQELGVDVLPGFPAGALLTEGPRVLGVRTAASGLDRDGNPLASYLPPTDVVARVTALADGTRGLLTQAYLEWQQIGSANPQIYALGVKELWETKRPLDTVIHTMGWPLPKEAFGGSFMYPMEPNLVALGLVVGLDHGSRDLDVHVLLQQMKRHPLFRPFLEGGELLEWGAKTIPEGGFYSFPERWHGDGVVLLGDAAGLVDVPSLKGIHYAMQSGMFAARAIAAALEAGDTSATHLAEYDRLVEASYIRDDLYRTRNMRLAFKGGFYAGGIKAGLMTLSGGRLFGRKIDVPRDADVPVSAPAAPSAPFHPDGTLTFSKLDAVYKSGNTTRDTIPSHLVVGKAVPPEVAAFYSHMCPAGVYEVVDGELRVNPPNCVDCKATDVLGPRWTPREGGAGPAYQRM